MKVRASLLNNCLIMTVITGLSALYLAAPPAHARTGRANLVYVLNNSPAPGQNAVLGYIRNADGTLTELPRSPFYTDGTGYRNVDERIGPDDTDQELIVSPDRRFMFAVNEGSDTVAVFTIRLDGSLRAVPGSPFKSGGKQPSSLAISNGYLYVVNRGDGILSTPQTPNATTGTPGATNYCVFSIGLDGTLQLLPQLTLIAPDGSSPSQVVASADGQFLFGNNFLTPSSDAPFAPIFPFSHSLLVSAALDEDDGSMVGQPLVALPEISQFVLDIFRPQMLGLKAHPTENILYVGAVTAGLLSVWTWDDNGVLTFVKPVDPGSVGTAGGLCWLAIDPAAKWLYSASVGPNKIGVFSIADPMNPVLLQNFTLGGAKGPLPFGTPEPYNFTTAPFNLAVDPAGKLLYVVNHSTCTSISIDAINCPAGNAMHVLAIGADGTLTETSGSPIIFPKSRVADDTHPKGLVVM